MGVVLVVGTQKGAILAHSNDTRQKWDIGDLLFKGWIVTATARDAGGRYYLAATHFVYGAVVMVSDDLTTWRQIEKGPKYEASDVGSIEHLRMIGRSDPAGAGKPPTRTLDQIWTFHVAGDRVYAGVSEAGLFRSDDRGESWQPVRGLNDHADREKWNPGAGGLCAHSVLVDPNNPNRIWVGISAVGVFRSDDGGATWTDKNDGIRQGVGYCVHGLAQDRDRPDVIYRQDHRGMYRTADAGDTWQLIENGLPVSTLYGGDRAAFGFPVVIDPRTKAVYAVPLESDEFHVPHEGKLRVYRSADEGQRWEALASGLPPEAVYTSVLRGAMSVDGLSPCGIYFGTSSGSVYGSNDGGDSWSRLPATLPRVLSVKAFAE